MENLVRHSNMLSYFKFNGVQNIKKYTIKKMYPLVILK